ncbi:hypothetical protein BU16DRAFT_229891 [Lophium mytilinum]|uniref:Uncharacterized protein n=1 Tax=Lophium mytilinum TaxID=390894 RepID=A0A6A6Q8B7_9PEZI|nr:hypothetical protein BU16DRAFT_229891 [Lophium mytilinum]
MLLPNETRAPFHLRPRACVLHLIFRHWRGLGISSACASCRRTCSADPWIELASTASATGLSQVLMRGGRWGTGPVAVYAW